MAHFLQRLIFAAAILCAPSASLAQTAEETVLFITLAYEPSGSIWKNSKIQASRTNSCKYSVVVTTASLRMDIAFDFTNMSDYDVRPWDDLQRRVPEDQRRWMIAVKGSQLFDAKLVDLRTNQRIDKPELRGDDWEPTWWFPASTMGEIRGRMADRLQRAATYFRSNFCKGRAF